MAAPTLAATGPVAGARGFALATAVLVALLAVAPHLGVYPVFLMKALCFALFACAFNLLLGFGGLLSFGHAMFLGTAGYVAAHAAKVWGLSPELAILAGTAAATALGVVAGALAIRRQGIYFAMITLALAQMIYFFCVQAPFTHGEDGIQSVPRGMMFGVLDLSNTLVMYYVVLAIFVGGFLLTDPHGAGGVLLGAAGHWWPALVLWFFVGLTFGSVQIGAATMLMEDRNRPGPHRGIGVPALLAPALLRVRARR